MGLNMYRADWTPDEDAVLRRMASSHSSYEIGEALKRTHRSVEARARRLRLPVSRPNAHWTPEEDALLRAHHGALSVKQLAVIIDRRSPSAIHNRLGVLGLSCRQPEKGRKWTPEEDQMIRDGVSAREIERRTGRTAKAVRMRKSVLLGIKATPRASREDDDDEIVKAPPFTPADELAILQAEYPGRSYPNLRIPSEGFAVRRFSVPLNFTASGSVGAMCAEAI
jgi:hypothetical protein